MTRAKFIEQIHGKERLGPWRVDHLTIKALLSLWTYQFKKEFDRNHVSPNDFVFVIGPANEYNEIYRKWISRYSPENPVYINPNLTQLARREGKREGRELHEFAYIGHSLPSQDPIKSRAHKHEIARKSVVTRPPWEYIGYQYQSLLPEYMSTPS